MKQNPSPVMTPYRMMRWLYLHHVPLLPRLIHVVWFRLLLGCYIPPQCQIGEGTQFPHGALGVVIHQEAVIGRCCKIQCHAVIGGRGGRPGAPVLGDHVLVGAHAIILGNIHIGDHAAIAAGAIVTEDVPDHMVMACNKAQAIGVLEPDRSVF